MPHNQPVIPVEAPDGHRFELIHVAAPRPQHHLLFLPGMGLSARLFIAVAKTLAEHGVEVFIHEWRGNGSSNRRASRHSNWSYRELLDDIAAARQAVTEHAPNGHLLGGHSLGSQFACLTAAARPEGCRGLVIIAGGAPYWRVFPWPMKGVMIATMFAFPALGSLLGYYPGKRVGFAGNEARNVMADWARSARTGRYQPAGPETDLEAGLRNLQIPVLALAMANDWLVPAGSIDWLVGKLTRCDVSKRVIEADIEDGKADHYTWMKRPQATADAIEHWLDGQSSSIAATRRA